MGYYDVRFNDRPDHLFGDKRVRQAFAYAIDKEALVKQVTDGAGTAVYGDILPTSWAYDASATVRYKQDLDKSRQLLKDAGWTAGPDGILVKAGKRFSADLYVRNDADVRNKAAVAIAAQVKAVGMELKPAPTDFQAFFEPLRTGKYDLALSGFATGPDPDNFYVLHSSQLQPENTKAGFNWSGYANPELDRLIALERSTLVADPARTRAERRKIFAQIEKLLGEDVVTYFLWADTTLQGFDSRVAGVRSGTLVNEDYGRNVRDYTAWYLKKP
jgi:peptide/nickel transport system substrate-binding protein